MAADLSQAQIGPGVQADHVLGLGGASRALATLTIRCPVGRALDLGSGCGVQALNVASFSTEVVGSDVSKRTLA